MFLLVCFFCLFAWPWTQVMAAIQDVTQNGMSAMSKYQDDPEILAVIEELKSMF